LVRVNKPSWWDLHGKALVGSCLIVGGEFEWEFKVFFASNSGRGGGNNFGELFGHASGSIAVPDGVVIMCCGAS
jgi:hypothetical protein